MTRGWICVTIAIDGIAPSSSCHAAPEHGIIRHRGPPPRQPTQSQAIERDPHGALALAAWRGKIMSRIRKRILLERASPVSEMASEIRKGFDNLADAVRTLSGVMASVAAGANTHNPGDQRNMAAVIYADASERFGDVHKKLDPKLQKQMESWLDGLCKTKR